MSKKSRKIKKSKFQNKQTLLASEIDYFIKNKFDIEDNGFWDWFFNGVGSGETNILSLTDGVFIQPHIREYYRILRQEFSDQAEDDINNHPCIEIENDLI